MTSYFKQSYCRVYATITVFLLVQASIYKGSEKLDQFKLLMDWNQEEMEQWAVAQRQKEEDNKASETASCFCFCVCLNLAAMHGPQ